ncbi:hypothetical protein ACEZHJ_02370 [Arhodomonas sp. KWT2]|uniref:hypothetical protein n=1 Tax=unclassified Arhodomonas TaxID=2621637 RepID=UPI0013D0AB37|nr:hypothetical protein [Arhodomonas sp. KWT]
MNAQQLLNFIDTDDLTYEATSLMAWEVGAVDNIDDVARYMWRGGPVPPQASANRPRRFLLSEEDHRPEKKYWDLVKREMFEFLCERSEKYEFLWERIGELEKKSSHVLVVVISGYIGEKSGVEARGENRGENRGQGGKTGDRPRFCAVEGGRGSGRLNVVRQGSQGGNSAKESARDEDYSGFLRGNRGLSRVFVRVFSGFLGFSD